MLSPKEEERSIYQEEANEGPAMRPDRIIVGKVRGPEARVAARHLRVDAGCRAENDHRGRGLGEEPVG